MSIDLMRELGFSDEESRAARTAAFVEERKSLVGKVVRWTHGKNVLVGKVTRYDAADDEFFIVPDGLVSSETDDGGFPLWERAVQGEPTDAQVRAALDTWAEGDFHALYPESVRHWEPKMRAALRAASAVGGADVAAS